MLPSKQTFLVRSDRTTGKFTGSTEIEIDKEAMSLVNLTSKTYKQRVNYYKKQGYLYFCWRLGYNVDWAPEDIPKSIVTCVKM